MRGAIAALCLLCSCGYQFEGAKPDGGVTTLSIPYIKGDGAGQLNADLSRAFAASGLFECVQEGGELILRAEIVADGDDRIGYRFDRNPTTGKLRDNIVGTENRRAVTVQITLIDAYTEQTLLGPQIIHASADYDYVDQNSIRDLVFETTSGTPQKVLDFSLGQLDSLEGAHDDSSAVVFRVAAQKIVDGLIVRRAIQHAH